MEEKFGLSFNCELKGRQRKDLESWEETLVQKSLEARNFSRSPYSKFQVGAALLLSNGEHVLGANQENAAYPSGLCAERTALFSAAVQFPGIEIVAIGVSIPDHAPHIPFPCGGCLQVMAEYEYEQKSPMKVYLIHPNGEQVYIAEGLRNLLPFGFNESHLPE